VSPFRGALLWASRNGWLREHVPRWRFVRRATRRFMPGEDAGAALAAAQHFRDEGIGAVLTHLGENVTSLAEAEAVAMHYLDVLATARAQELAVEVSVKPTQLGLDLDETATLGHLRRLAVAQAAAGGMLWLDMEDHTYVERTLALVRALRVEELTVGVCLQAYLRRTAGRRACCRPCARAAPARPGPCSRPTTWRSSRASSTSPRALPWSTADTSSTCSTGSAWPISAGSRGKATGSAT
jgi:hypothetical protein